MQELAAATFLVGAGVLAGVVGTAGGITSLVAYPALLAVGLPPLAANVTNSVALLGSGVSSALRAGPDVVWHRGTLRRWLPQTVLLSLLGAVLLVVTPVALFDRVVPFLVLGGATLLLVQPSIARRQQAGGATSGPLPVALCGAGVALYNGYFGAGSGILLITLIGPSVARRLPEAVLRVLIGCCGVVLAAYLFVRT